jgi:surfeit locus 1 family protein
MNPMHKRRIAAIAGILLALLTARLGVWQLDRADEKTRLTRLAQQRAAAQPWRAGDWPCRVGGPVELALPQRQPVVLRGRWVPEHTVFLDNRPMGGRPGFFVITPLRLSTSACPDGVVLVQRGWWPRDALDRQRLPDWSDPTEEVEVRGEVLAQVSRTYALGEEPAPPAAVPARLRQNVDDVFWRARMGQSPLPGAVLQRHPEQVVQGGAAVPELLRNWPEPDAGVDKHHGYAAQWFALSGLSVGLTAWFAWWLPTRRPRAPFTPAAGA